MAKGADTDSGNGEQPDPLAADNRTQRKTGKNEPCPPGLCEGLVLVFVAETRPEEDGERSEEDERRVEENVS